MDHQNAASAASNGKKTWISPSIKAIDLNSARFQNLKGTDGTNAFTKS